jgi:hypothetical protein
MQRNRHFPSPSLSFLFMAVTNSAVLAEQFQQANIKVWDFFKVIRSTRKTHLWFFPEQ